MIAIIKGRVVAMCPFVGPQHKKITKTFSKCRWGTYVATSIQRMRIELRLCKLYYMQLLLSQSCSKIGCHELLAPRLQIFLLHRAWSLQRGKKFITELCLWIKPNRERFCKGKKFIMSRTLVAVARIFLLFLGTASVTHSDLASDEKECGSQLQTLATCLPYVQGSAPTPAKDCCDALLRVHLNNPKCLCVLIKESSNPQLGLTINRTLALHLPEDCKVATNASKCPGLLHISPSSPDARIFTDKNSSSDAPAAASAAPAATAAKSSPSKSFGSEIRPRMSWTALGCTVGGAAYLWFCILWWG